MTLEATSTHVCAPSASMDSARDPHIFVTPFDLPARNHGLPYGATIRNLERALDEAEKTIRRLRTGSTAGYGAEVSRGEQNRVEEANKTLEAKLIQEQHNLAMKDRTISTLTAQITNFETAYATIKDRISSMIKEDSWMLPNHRIPTTPRTHTSGSPSELMKDMLQLLDTLELVRADSLNYKKKEIETQSQTDVSLHQQELQEAKRQNEALERRCTELQTELRAVREHETQSELHIMKLTSQVEEMKSTMIEMQSKHRTEATLRIQELEDATLRYRDLSTELENARQSASQTVVRRRSKVEASTEPLQVEMPACATQTSPAPLPDVSPALVNRTSVKRALSPIFGAVSTQEGTASVDQEVEEQPAGAMEATTTTVSPTPRIDALYTGASEPKSATRASRAKAKAKVSAPSTPQLGAVARRKRSKRVEK